MQHGCVSGSGKRFYFAVVRNELFDKSAHRLNETRLHGGQLSVLRGFDTADNVRTVALLWIET